MFAKRFSDDMYEKVEEILNRIVKRDWMVFENFKNFSIMVGKEVTVRITNNIMSFKTL